MGDRFGHVSLEINRSLQKVSIIAIVFLGLWYVSPTCWKWPRVTSRSSGPSSILRTAVTLYSRNFPWRLGCSLTCSIRATRSMRQSPQIFSGELLRPGIHVRYRSLTLLPTTKFTIIQKRTRFLQFSCAVAYRGLTWDVASTKFLCSGVSRYPRRLAQETHASAVCATCWNYCFDSDGRAGNQVAATCHLAWPRQMIHG